jgi:hypothetical protein
MLHNIDHKKPGKHCHNCIHLEYWQGEVEEPEGWVCLKRNYNSVDDEGKHLRQLDSEKYRFKGKVCFEGVVV